MAEQRTYTGYSGQMAVMAELLFLQCNVAVPTIDLGTDTFAFRDDREEIARIQIKAVQGTPYKVEEGCSAQFDIPMKQLRRPDKPPLYYVLAVRLEEKWAEFLVVSREDLNSYWNGDQKFGTPNNASGNLVLTIQFRPNSVRCGTVELTTHRNAWMTLPPFRPLPVVKPEAEQANGEDQGEAAVIPDHPVPPPLPPPAPAPEEPPHS